MRKAAGHSVEIVIIEAGAVSLIFRVNWRHFGRRGGGYGNYRVDLPLVITLLLRLEIAKLKSTLLSSCGFVNNTHASFTTKQ